MALQGVRVSVERVHRVKFVRCGVALSLSRLGAVFACTALLFSLAGVSQAEERTITMYNIHTKETASITFKRNGKYVPEGLQAINHFMRDWRVNRETRIDPALIDIIWECTSNWARKRLCI